MRKGRSHTRAKLYPHCRNLFLTVSVSYAVCENCRLLFADSFLPNIFPHERLLAPTLSEALSKADMLPRPYVVICIQIYGEMAPIFTPVLFLANYGRRNDQKFQADKIRLQRTSFSNSAFTMSQVCLFQPSDM